MQVISDSTQGLLRDPPQPEASAVFLAFRTFMFLLIDIVVGIVLFYLSDFEGKKTTAFTDSFYFSSTTMTTTGYGDVVPASVASKILTVAYIIFSAYIVNFFISLTFSCLVQSLEGRDMPRRRRIVYCVMHSLGCILIGIPLFGFENIGWENSLYAVIVSFSSTGLGDFAFSSVWGRIVGSVWLLICHLVNYRLGCLVFEEGDMSFVQDERDAVRGESLQAGQNSAQEANDVRNESLQAAQNSAQEANDARVKAEKALEQAKEIVIKKSVELEQAEEIVLKKTEELEQAKELGKKKSAELADAILEKRNARTEARAAQQLVSEKSTQIHYLEKEKIQMRRDLKDLLSKLGEKTVELRDANFELKWLQHPS